MGHDPNLEEELKEVSDERLLQLSLYSPLQCNSKIVKEVRNRQLSPFILLLDDVIDQFFTSGLYDNFAEGNQMSRFRRLAFAASTRINTIDDNGLYIALYMDYVWTFKYELGLTTLCSLTLKENKQDDNS